MPGDVLVQAVRAMAGSGLEFGACDLIWNQKREKAYILEINCAPGLEGTTVEIYRDAIKRYFGDV
jgi:D-alanine-D-alanine ligase-like ATP-grasp enzyme